MNAFDCMKIIEHIETIRHVANGGFVQHARHDYTGKFLGWSKPINKVLIPCLGSYRIYKPRFRVSNGVYVQETMP